MEAEALMLLDFLTNNLSWKRSIRLIGFLTAAVEPFTLPLSPPILRCREGDWLPLLEETLKLRRVSVGGEVACTSLLMVIADLSGGKPKQQQQLCHEVLSSQIKTIHTFTTGVKRRHLWYGCVRSRKSTERWSHWRQHRRTFHHCQHQSWAAVLSNQFLYVTGTLPLNRSVVDLEKQFGMIWLSRIDFSQH